MNNFGLFIKDSDKNILGIARKFIREIDPKKYSLVLTKKHANTLHTKIKGTSRLKDFKKTSGVITIGGDGTMLRAGRIFSKMDIPILGVNLGRRGFLTEVQINEASLALSKIAEGRYALDERIMIDCIIKRDNKTVANLEALNDIVIGKNGIARIIRLEASTDDNFLTSYAGDGLIIATPTGSTGHNLSAGGPILEPNLSVIVLTAICSLSISNRSIVVSGEKKLEIEINTVPKGIDVMLTADGQKVINLNEGDKIIIQKSKYTTKFIRLGKYNFFQVLKEKIGWGG